jgi:hypothetical protein
MMNACGKKKVPTVYNVLKEEKSQKMNASWFLPVFLFFCLFFSLGGQTLKLAD